MRRVLSFALVLTVAAGCTTVRSPLTRTSDDFEGYAAPGPDLVGTWRGTAFAVGDTLYHISTPVELVIAPDGTWTWNIRGAEQGRGRVVARGNDVILREDWARKGSTQTTNAAEEVIDLERRGDELWGVTRAFIPGAQNAVQLRKVTS